jgi:DNA-binding MarR family transcriptional regulator
MGDSKSILQDCLYFTANSLARTITKMAEQEFRRTGISPALAFLLMVVVEEPGIGQKQLAVRLNLAASTVTRLADSLVHQGYLTKEQDGKIVNHFPTKEGKIAYKQVRKAWSALYGRYTKILGKRAGDKLTRDTFDARGLLEDDV